MSGRRNQIHVIKDKDNSWSTKREPNSKRTLSRSKTQTEAIGRAITQAKREGNAEIIVHGLNGKIKA